MRTKRRSAALLALGVMVSAGLLALCFRDVELDDFWSELRHVDVGVLCLSPLCTLLGFTATTLRTRILLAPLRRLSFSRLFRSVLLAFAVNNVIPFRAGELARVGYLARHGILPASSCLAVVAVERMLDLLVAAVVFAVVLPMAAVEVSSPVYMGFGIGLAAIALAVIASRFPDSFVKLARLAATLFGKAIGAAVEARARTFAEGLKSLGSPLAVVATALLTLVFWLSGVGAVQVWLWAFGFELPWFAPVVVLAFLTLGLAVPSTPGNIGTFHFFAYSALVTLGLPEASATSFAVVTHVVAVVPFTVIAIPLFLREYAKSVSNPAPG